MLGETLNPPRYNRETDGWIASAPLRVTGPIDVGMMPPEVLLRVCVTGPPVSERPPPPSGGDQTASRVFYMHTDEAIHQSTDKHLIDSTRIVTGEIAPSSMTPDKLSHASHSGRCGCGYMCDARGSNGGIARKRQICD